MYIEITPQTELPVFETYLDGNGGTETADGNDNGINTATQFDYLDGNFDPLIPFSSSTDFEIEIDTALNYNYPTEIIYDSDRLYPAVCAYYINGVQQRRVAYLDGNINLIESMEFFHTENVDGNTHKASGNAPDKIDSSMTIEGIVCNNVKTGDIINGDFIFKYDDFIRIQKEGDTNDYQIHFGLAKAVNKNAPLAANIAFTDDNIDYSLLLPGGVIKRGYLYPNIFKAYTDLSYEIINPITLNKIKGKQIYNVGSDLYRDDEKIVAEGGELLITTKSYSDSSGLIYNNLGKSIGKVAEHVNIALDESYTGVKKYLYDITAYEDIPESSDGLTIVTNGHEEYRLKGVILSQGEFGWAVLQYIHRDLYSIISFEPILEDMEKIRNKELTAVIVFNKELTT